MRALLLLFAAAAVLPAQIPRIGVIDFYGLRKVPVDRVRKAAGIREGDPLPASKGNVEDRIAEIPGIVLARLEAVCCVGDRVILYIGVEERDAPHFDLRDAPARNITLPKDVVEAYHDFLHTFEKAARAGETAEDLSQGHALSADPASRAYQESFVSLAIHNSEALHQVVRESFDPEQRAIAAYLLGYLPKKELAVNDLQYALQDEDESVRANATRSLTAIAFYADHHPESGIRIQPTWFIEMLNSLVWSDRYRAATALVNLTEKRDPGVIDELRKRALGSLIEMARWRTLPHALPAFLLVGRVAGLPEKDIEDAWSRGDRESVIKRAQKSK